jgi:hypothetical protein
LNSGTPHPQESITRSSSTTIIDRALSHPEKWPASAENSVSQGFDNPTAAIETKNVRRALKSAEHQNNSGVLLQVSDGLDAASVEIQVGNGRGSDKGRNDK